MVSITELQKEHFVGGKLEVILFEGTRFTSDYGPTIAQVSGGYAPSERMTEKAGDLIMGYIAGYDVERNELLLTNRQFRRGRAPFISRIHEDCIYDVKKLYTTR
ncbi:MAG: hypothetical protein V1725_00815 [archaeon]